MVYKVHQDNFLESNFLFCSCTEFEVLQEFETFLQSKGLIKKAFFCDAALFGYFSLLDTEHELDIDKPFRRRPLYAQLTSYIQDVS